MEDPTKALELVGGCKQRAKYGVFPQDFSFLFWGGRLMVRLMVRSCSTSLKHKDFRGCLMETLSRFPSFMPQADTKIISVKIRPRQKCAMRAASYRKIKLHKNTAASLHVEPLEKHPTCFTTFSMNTSNALSIVEYIHYFWHSDL